MAQHDTAFNASLLSEVTTLRHMHDYFGELKRHAGELQESIDAVGRGYFVADEDDAVRGLLISYFQSRNALLEVVDSYRHRFHDLSEVPLQEFLVPYAAALVLVDGALFLRKLANNRPVVRRKLNEPVPEFGIPGGIYDTVQKSLFSSRNAWHLHQATRHFSEIESDLEKEVAKTELRDVLQLARELRGHAQVPRRRFIKAKLATQWDRWLRKWGRNSVGHWTYSLQKLVSGMMAGVYVRPGHEPALPDTIARQLVSKVLKPGDVLVVRKEFAITNYFLPGYWPHVAMFIGCPSTFQSPTDSADGQGESVHFHDSIRKAEATWKNQIEKGAEACVVESMKDGVHVRDVATPFRSDSVVVIRPRLSPDQIGTAICRALQHVGKPYDFNFDFRRADRLVCTEVVYRAMEGIGPIRFPLVNRFGRPTLSGHDLMNAAVSGHHFDLVCAFIPSHSCDLQSDASLHEVVRSKLDG